MKRLRDMALRLDLSLGERICRDWMGHDHDYVDDPPPATGFLRMRFEKHPVMDEVPCPKCPLLLEVEPDGGELWVACEREHGVFSDDPLWHAALAANGYARVCVNWWEEQLAPSPVIVAREGE